jgi:CYTH domain-containing protein
MALVRRFLIASAVARLIRRERGVTSRIVEGHFPPRPDRSQFVRVERDECFLVLNSRAEDGEFRTEQSRVPLSHAEALVDVAPGRVAFDRTELPLGLSAEGWLDRFVVPSGLDLLTVSTGSDPRHFAPPLWVGREVTDEPNFENAHLALSEIGAVDSGEVSNQGLEAFIDWIEGKSLYSFPARTRSAVSSSAKVEAAPGSPGVPTREMAERTAVIVGEVLAPVTDVAQSGHSSAVLSRRAEPATPAPEPPAVMVPSGSEADEDQLPGPRCPTLRGEAPELEDGIARLARSFTPRRLRSLLAPEPVKLRAE